MKELLKERQEDVRSPLVVFYVYANEDQALQQELEKHLSLLRRQGIISTWYNREIIPGTDWQQEISARLKLASLILLLVSPDFLVSDYCYSVEMQQALERHAQGEAYVIPIILRPVDWQDAPFSSLQGLPRDLKPVTIWPNQDEAFLNIAQGIRWHAKRLLGEIENNPRPLSADEQAAVLLQKTAETLSPEQLRNRQRFLAYLNAEYRDVFAQKLQGMALIPPGMRTAPEAVELGSKNVFRHLQRAEQTVPEGTSIVDLYQQSAGELLILGEPGSGKSTLLLQLAESLCQKAERDVQQQLPVILNLSSWTQKPRPLSVWLIEQLLLTYQVPLTLGRQWVQQGRILPLLDGLDEVAAELRGSCIDAINAYRRDYFVPVVVCSRTGDYLLEQRRLIMQRAVIVQPLSDAQIDEYLSEPDASLSGVHALLQQSKALRELAASPLMLNTLAVTYRNTSDQALPESASPEEQQQQIFASYLKRVLSSKKKEDRKSLLSPLSWLAQQMRRRNQSTFYLEQLQPDWLLDSRQASAYKLLAVRLPGIVMGALISLIICTFLITVEAPSLVMCALLGGVVGGVLSQGGSGYHLFSQEERRWRPSWRSLLLWLVVSIIIGAIIGRELNLYFGIGAGIYCFLLQTRLCTSRPAPASKLSSQAAHPSFWRKITHVDDNVALRNGFLAGLFAWLLFGLAEILPYFNIYPYLPRPVLAGMGTGGGVVDIVADLTVILHRPTFLGFRGLGYAISFALVAAALSTLLINRDVGVLIADQLNWSWSSLIKSLLNKRHLIRFLQVVILVGSFIGFGMLVNDVLGSELPSFLMFGIQGVHTFADLPPLLLSYAGSVLDDMASSLSDAFGFGLTAGLAFGLGYWLLVGLFQGVASQAIPPQSRVVPNEGIHRSFFNGLWLGLASAFIVGGVCFICSYLYAMLNVVSYLGISIFSLTIPTSRVGDAYKILRSLQNNVLLTSLVLGLSAFGVVGLLMGGWAALRHYVLRMLLARAGVLPWKLPALLEEASRRILLRKIGSGYAFIHQLFLDYIASLKETTNL